jgi:hypothetical protein
MQAALVTLLALVGAACALNITTLTPSPGQPTNDTLVLLDRRAYQELSVAAWQRPDPNATLLVADDFVVPTGVDRCTGLTVDIVLLRAMGRDAGNYRAPTNATLRLWDGRDFLLNRSLAKTAAPLAQWTVQAPTEPQGWSSSDGETVNTSAYYYHVETLRFVLHNLTVYGGRTYWLGFSVALERAFNSTDFSQNQPRWMLSATGMDGPDSTYRVVDVGGNMYRDVPLLQNWTSAASAEPTVLPFLTVPPTPMHSDTKQLAMAVFATECSVYPNAGVARVASMPPRYAEPAVQVPPPPVESSSPSATSTPDASPSSPDIVASPVSWPSPAQQPTPPASKNVVPSPSSPPPPTIAPPVLIGMSMSWTPPPSFVWPDTTPPEPDSNVTSTPPPPPSSLSTTSMILLICGVGVFIILVVGFLFLVARHYKLKYSQAREYEHVNDETSTSLRPAVIDADDDDGEVADSLPVTTDAVEMTAIPLREGEASK